jgi:hydroxypyruvate reductase
MNKVREDANKIIKESIKAVLPEDAVVKALTERTFEKDVVIVAIGKAAWNMAKAAKDTLGSRVKKGIVITKYNHSKGPIDTLEIIEASHPVPDNNSVKGATRALELVSDLTDQEEVVLLISGGGSALFEKPMEGLYIEDIIQLTNQLLSCGADIIEINTIRKHLSAVKGGRFAKECGDVSIYAIVLSDVIGDRLDSIASGPAYPDSSTSKEAFEIIEKYNLTIEPFITEVLSIETPKKIENCETVIMGSVPALCEAAANCATNLGYRPLILTSSLECEAREAGKFLAAIAREIKNNSHNGYGIDLPCAIIAGGETVVRIIGNGKGGRNQELALSAALGIEGIEDVVVFSLGSDGTDGPTDAAGGIIDGETTLRIRNKGRIPEVDLDNNDSYHALSSSEDLIITGPTGTNVNDLMLVLAR